MNFSVVSKKLSDPCTGIVEVAAKIENDGQKWHELDCEWRSQIKGASSNGTRWARTSTAAASKTKNLTSLFAWLAGALSTAKHSTRHMQRGTSACHTRTPTKNGWVAKGGPSISAEVRGTLPSWGSSYESRGGQWNSPHEEIKMTQQQLWWIFMLDVVGWQ